MATHSSTLAWKIPWTRSLVGYSPWGRKESDTTERLHFISQLIYSVVLFSASQQSKSVIHTDISNLFKIIYPSRSLQIIEQSSMWYRVSPYQLPVLYFVVCIWGFPGSSAGKEFCNARDPGSIPGLGRSLGEGIGHPLQHSYCRISMDRGAWVATVHGVIQLDTTEQLSTAQHSVYMNLFTKQKLSRSHRNQSYGYWGKEGEG